MCLESMISKHQMVDGLTDLDRDMVLYTAVYVVKLLALIRVQLTHGRTDYKFCLTIANHPDDFLMTARWVCFTVKIPLSCCAAMKMERRCYGR
ncbi:hypothetical protein T02_1935 [Trichinella nativa]|uniref:Uncharacterized protein n=1 Tax=Trichinella nativa TaxID=6335 RepID=A0A0V1KYQ8_9BILA|nr:hypothetical protein T02_1935 [Trichinella nativa]